MSSREALTTRRYLLTSSREVLMTYHYLIKPTNHGIFDNYIKLPLNYFQR
jgi:hypothetical protein